jgi:multiple sugar transport system substrate-binding protein
MKLPMKIMFATAVGAVNVSLAACSSGPGSGGDAATSNLDGRGPIIYVQGKDNSGISSMFRERTTAALPIPSLTSGTPITPETGLFTERGYIGFSNYTG